MTAGIRITNDDSILIIDDQFVCMSLMDQGSATANILYEVSGMGGTTHPLYYKEITYAGGDSPLFVLRKTDVDSTATCLGATYDSGTNTWTFRVGVTSSLIVNDYGFDWYVFDRPAYNPVDYGLVIYDVDGAPVFNSSMKSMRIAGIGAGTYPSGTYGFCQLSALNVVNETYEISSPTGGIEIHDRYTATISGARCSSTSIVVEDVIVGSNGDSSYSYTPGVSETGPNSIVPLLVVDLSNL